MRTRPLVVVFFALVSLGGCSREALPGAPAHLNGMGDPDLGAPADLAAKVDLAVAPDLAAPGFRQPPGTAAVSFIVDDSANAVFTAGDLAWEGAMTYDPITRIATADPTWANLDYSKYPPLYDDGPWDADGHEPLGARAGDHVWGATVFVYPPGQGTDSYEYGLADRTYAQRFGIGWIWEGPNGLFVVPAGNTNPIAAQGITLPKFGSTDVQITLDTARLDACPSQCSWDTSVVSVRSSAFGWVELPLSAVGGGKYTLTLSDVVGPGHPLDHSGLLRRGEQPELVFLFGAGPQAREYKDLDANALRGGVSVAIGPRGGPFQQAALGLAPADRTITFMVP